MNIFEQSRYYFNYILPNIIFSNLDQLNNFLGQYWWIFFIFLILLIIINMNIFRKNFQLKLELKYFDEYYKNLSGKKDIKDVENFLLKSCKLVKANYGAIYELRGETYVLIESDTINEKALAAPLRIGKKNISNFTKSGNYNISFFNSYDKKFLLILFARKEIKRDRYEGFYGIILGYYENLIFNLKSKGSQALSNVSKETSISLIKLQMDKYQFFKFFIALIVKLTKAKGARLLTKNDELIFEQLSDKSAQKQKIFYIRNTPYKLEFFSDKPLKNDTITQIGSFLDMSGAFLENIDKDSEMVRNYIDLLKFTNEAIELENKYYKNHSKIVQIVSVEIAKSLFLSEEEIDTISLGAYLHDIGMIGDLLVALNSKQFGEKEMDLIKEHPLVGSIMTEPIAHIYPISDIIKYHHERFDGKGYPFGLKESQIPIEAQVVSVGEFYAGITSDRSYKKGRTHEEAIKEIEKSRNKMFNDVIVNVFLDTEKSIKNKIEKLKATTGEQHA